jgi:hypothetical protein
MTSSKIYGKFKGPYDRLMTLNPYGKLTGLTHGKKEKHQKPFDQFSANHS